MDIELTPDDPHKFIKTFLQAKDSFHTNIIHTNDIGYSYLLFA
ncbi:hypothetical protein LCGC14_1611130 [marine sediment metagenome]|uniref:Uncharacterized protein n=1 Tax=marine sediment metagenome TaxID=412755 RepID=A0A0F9KNZ7_9ZZZZ